jgi:hypothetical protein
METMQANTYKDRGDGYKFSSEPKEAHALGNGYWFTFETTIEMKRPNGPVVTRIHGINAMVPEGKGWKVAATTVGTNVPGPGAPPQR